MSQTQCNWWSNVKQIYGDKTIEEATHSCGVQLTKKFRFQTQNLSWIRRKWWSYRCDETTTTTSQRRWEKNDSRIPINSVEQKCSARMFVRFNWCASIVFEIELSIYWATAAFSSFHISFLALPRSAQATKSVIGRACATDKHRRKKALFLLSIHNYCRLHFHHFILFRCLDKQMKIDGNEGNSFRCRWSSPPIHSCEIFSISQKVFSRFRHNDAQSTQCKRGVDVETHQKSGSLNANKSFPLPQRLTESVCACTCVCIRWQSSFRSDKQKSVCLRLSGEINRNCK